MHKNYTLSLHGGVKFVKLVAHCVHLAEHFAHAERLSKLSRVSTSTEKLVVFMKNTIFTFKKLIFMNRKRL